MTVTHSANRALKLRYLVDYCSDTPTRIALLLIEDTYARLTPLRSAECRNSLIISFQHQVQLIVSQRAIYHTTAAHFTPIRRASLPRGQAFGVRRPDSPFLVFQSAKSHGGETKTNKAASGLRTPKVCRARMSSSNGNQQEDVGVSAQNKSARGFTSRTSNGNAQTFTSRPMARSVPGPLESCQDPSVCPCSHRRCACTHLHLHKTAC